MKMKIIPMTDLKDTVKIEKICSETKVPVFVTKNGYCKLVVMDLECFERLMKQSYEAKIINEGIEDLNDGRAIDGGLVKEELGNKYGF